MESGFSTQALPRLLGTSTPATWPQTCGKRKPPLTNGNVTSTLRLRALLITSPLQSQAEAVLDSALGDD